MERSWEELERVVRGQICKVCADRQVDGTCGLEDPSRCALFRLFPEVVDAIQATNSDDIRDYVRAIRQKVCTVCEEQAPNGSCQAREQVRCALDAYLLLIVDAIEQALGKKFDRPSELVTWNLSAPTAPAKSN